MLHGHTARIAAYLSCFGGLAMKGIWSIPVYSHKCKKSLTHLRTLAAELTVGAFQKCLAFSSDGEKQQYRSPILQKRTERDKNNCTR
jgi:hypothetical protein